MRTTLVTLGLLICFSAAVAPEEAVVVKGSHLCCGGCVAAAEEALDGLPGITKIAADTNSKTITFVVKNADAAKTGIRALAAAGFYGKSEYLGKPLSFPRSNLKKGSKASQFTIEGLHLCCTACVTGAHECLQDVPGVNLIDIDRSEKTITVSGADISLESALKSLRDGGFFGQIRREKKDGN